MRPKMFYILTDVTFIIIYIFLYPFVIREDPWGGRLLPVSQKVNPQVSCPQLELVFWVIPWKLVISFSF
jgi:hypothetical protein